ncbi:MAG: YCF48-related protein [Bacteroidales bacterium]|nr:YCF48-related protein [Bacteroidales bacterium]
MKKQITIFTLLLVLLVSKTGTAQTSDWQWQNPLPQGNHLAEIHVFDENTAIAVGNIGTIIKTTNGGISWDMQESNTQEYLNSVFFIDNNTGWAVGNNKVLLKTTDGGTSWTTIVIDPDPYTFWNLYSIFFIDENIGWMTGSTTHTYKTTDGGMTWSPLIYAPEYGGQDIQFIDQNLGWMVSGGTVYRSTTGGQYWEFSSIYFNNAGDYPYAIHFIDANTGWVVGGNPANGGGLISKTTDGGVTWTAQTSGISEVLYSVFFTDANNGWAVGDDKILNTIDGGANWMVQTLLIPENSIIVRSVKFTNNSIGFVVGDFGVIYKTTNMGTDWVSQLNSVVPFTNAFNGVDFIDETTGFAVGVVGSIVKTTDGGSSWVVKSSGISNPLNNVEMIDNNTGWVTGGSGKIIKTTDGGETWIEQPTGVTNTLYGLHFPVDALTGWVTGTSGRILKTTDGGTNWSTQTSGVTASLRAAYFIDNNTGFIVGSNGKVLKTINGGANWTNQTIGSTTLILNSIYFTNPSTGWIVAASGRIFGTIDSGISWQEKTSGTGWALYSVKSTPNSVIVVGNGGIILKSTDGGDSWIPQNSKSYNLLYSVDLINDSTLWAVGTKGTILHTGSATAPAAFTVTGGGSYCEGESGLPVGLANSETGVTYILYKDNVALVPTIPGTGSFLSFGNQTAGTYTVEGTNSAGTTPMTGSAVITENPALAVSVTISANINPVPAGNEVTLTALPVNGGSAPSYQWMVNGINAGTDNPVFTYTPVNNDAVTCTLTSEEACATGNPAVSNEIILSVIPSTVSLLNIVVANSETNCYNALQTIYVAGNGNTFNVQAGGSATLIAGQNIIYLPGTTADSGSYMLGYITLNGNYCTTPSNPLVSNLLKDGESLTTGNNVPVTDNFRIYPNPTTGMFTLEQTGFISDQTLKLEIYTMLGKRLISDNIAVEKKHQFNLSEVPAGIYLIRIMTGEKIETIKLVKQ